MWCVIVAAADEWPRTQAREIVLPTDDGLVQARLRELSQPIKLFGESKAARRER